MPCRPSRQDGVRITESVAHEKRLAELEAALEVRGGEPRAPAAAAKKVAAADQMVDEYHRLRRARGAMNWRRAGATFTKAVEVGGTATVSVAHGPADEELRIVAVATDGTEVPPTSRSDVGAAGVGQTTATFENLPLKRVKSFRLQAPPFGRGGQGGLGGVGQRRGARPAPTPLSVAEAVEAVKPGGELDADRLAARERDLNDVLTELREARKRLGQSRGERDKALAEAGGRKLTVEDFARVDPDMAAMVRARAEDQTRYDAELAKLRPPQSDRG